MGGSDKNKDLADRNGPSIRPPSFFDRRLKGRHPWDCEERLAGPRPEEPKTSKD